jgi:hypothetical protein
MPGFPRRARLTTLIGAALLLSSSAAVGQDVTYDFDKSADFGSVKTYVWVRGTPLADEINHQRVVDAIEAQLGAKGLQPARIGEQPDVFIAYHAAFARDLEVHAMSNGWGGYRFASRTGSARVEEVLIGTLVVDVIHAERKTTLWRGIASREIDMKATPDKREKNITKATEKLFKHYPPAI